MKKYIAVLFLIAFIIPSVAFASWWNPFSWKIFNRNSEPKIEDTAIVVSQIEKDKEIEKLKKEVEELKKKTNPVVSASKPFVPPVIPNNQPKPQTQNSIQQPQESIALKIAKCQAEKQMLYDKFVGELKQSTATRLEEIYQSLNNQLKETRQKLSDYTNDKIQEILNNSNYSPEFSDSLIDGVKSLEKQQSDELFYKQQIFYNEQKKTLQSSEEKGISNINSILSTQYLKCVSS